MFVIRQAFTQSQKARGEESAAGRDGGGRGARDVAVVRDGSNELGQGDSDSGEKSLGDRIIVAKSSHFQTVGLIASFFVQANGFKINNAKILDPIDPSSTFKVPDTTNKV